MNIDWTDIFNTLLPIGIGAIAYWLNHYFFNQLSEFHQLRKEIHENIIYFGNSWAMRDDRQIKHRHDAIDTTRRLAARLEAIRHSLTWMSQKWICFRKYDLNEAVGFLFSLHANLHSDDKFNYDQRSFDRIKIEKALKLPIHMNEDRAKHMANKAILNSD